MLLYDKKIFLLDDENEIIKMIESALRKDGFSKIFLLILSRTLEKL